MLRKKPFSGRQKKLQLQEKRSRKAFSDHHTSQSKWKSTTNSSERKRNHFPEVQGSSKQSSENEYNPKRFNLNFLREPQEEIERRKLKAQTVHISSVTESELEVDINDVYKPGSVLDMPKRPTWKYTMSKEQLEQKEKKYFQDYLDNIHSTFGSRQLSYFEHNLETWRQAWRVIEMSDIVVMVTDVRHPVLHFSPALYDHVINDLNKPLILVLNKIDLVPASVVAAWTSYFKKTFPFLHLICFTSFPQDVRTVGDLSKVKMRRKHKKRVYNTQIGPKEMLQVCHEICGDKVDLTTWSIKIEADLDKLGFCNNETSSAQPSAGGDVVSGDMTNQPLLLCEEDTPRKVDQHQESVNEMLKEDSNAPRFLDGTLTIGFIGHPNVGKSSLMNGLIGRKVVSTSVTPGHTKYFQTYFLTKTVKLCDSPGLVFPSLIPKQLQILSGIYPIAQVQEPYTPVGYLAARVALVQLLQLQHSKPSGTEEKWTAWDICEAWAIKRNYWTAKAARPDVYRAANAILRMAVDGRISMYMRPPGYGASSDYWDQHHGTSGLLALQATGDFHGEGRHTTWSFLNAEDLYSSDSSSTTDIVDSFSDEDGESSSKEDCDVTLRENNVQTFSNKFSALACDVSD